MKKPTKFCNHHKVEIHFHKEHKKSSGKAESENSADYNPKVVIITCVYKLF